MDEGTQVKAGDMIARLDDKDLLAELWKTEADIRQTTANLKKLEVGPTKEEIAVAKVAVAKADDRLRYAQDRLARLKLLFEQNLLARNDFDDARELAATAQNDLNDARDRLKLLLSGSRPEEIEATRAQLERLEAQRRYLQEQLGLLNVVSPVTGIVATPSRQLKDMRHQLVKKGDLIAKVYDFKTVTAQIVIPEKEIAEIEVGQPVQLRVRAYPGTEFSGVVTSIATAAQASASSAQALISLSNTVSANKTILVTTQIDNPDLLLKPEMTGQAKVSCGQKRIVDLITRRTARTFKVEFWSWW